MPRVLVIHRSDAALEREAVAGVVAILRGRDHDVISSAERAGIGGGEVADLERQADAADHILLVDPAAWWTRGPARDAWEQAVRERLEFCVANHIEQFAVLTPGRDGTLSEPLAAVPRFVLPGAWQALLERLSKPRSAITRVQTTGSLPTPRPAIARPAIEQAIAQAVATTPEDQGRLVWIRGAIGSGKSCLLSSWLTGRFAPQPAVVHIARPGIAATLRPSVVLERLAAALGLDALADLRSFPRDRARATVVVIDGLEQLLDRTDDRELDEQRRRFAASLAEPLPARLIVVASSRPLAPGLLGEREPTVDLDAPRWAADRRALLDALIATATRGQDPATLRELAGDNPGAARALLDLHGATLDEHDVPPSFAAVLERAFVRLLRLPPAIRRVVLAGLALLRAAPDPLPEPLLTAAIGEPSLRLLEQHAAEWLRREPEPLGEQLGLTHPFAARQLAAELDGRDAGPHVAILAGLARLRQRGRLDDASERYATQHEPRHRQAVRGLDDEQLWIRDVGNLRRAAADGSLEQRLATVSGGPEHGPLLAAMSEVLRQHSHALAADPDALPSRLWTGLIARGFEPSTLEAELSWSGVRPPILLQNPLTHVDRCYRILTGHAEPIRGCGLSLDASVAVTVSNDGLLRSWEPRSGAARHTVRIGGWSEASAMTPDGTRVVVGSNNTVVLIDLGSGKRIGEHQVHEATVTAIAISPDGTRVLSGDRDGKVVLWEPSGRKRTFELGKHGERVSQCTIAHDGMFGATGGSDKRVKIWTWSTGGRSLRAELRGHSYGICGLALTRDDRRLVSICIGEARVWDPFVGREIEKFDDLGQNCAGARVVADDREVLMAESGERITRWTLDDGEITTRHFAHPVDIHCLAATDDGEWYLTGGADHVARLWRRADLTGTEQVGTILPINGLLPGQKPDTVWVAGGGRTRLVALADRRTIVELDGYTNPNALARLEDRLFLAGTDRRLTVYSTETGRERSHSQPANDWLRCVAIDRERQRIACAGDDKQVFVAELDTRSWTSVGGHSDWIHAIAFAPDGRLIAVDGDGHIKIWDLDVEMAVRELSSTANPSLYALVIDSTGSRFATAGTGGHVEIYTLDGQLAHSLEGHAGAVRGLALRADDRVLVSTGADQTLRLWSFADGRALASFTAPFPLTQVIFVGERLVVGDVAGNLMIFTIDWSTIER